MDQIDFEKIFEYATKSNKQLQQAKIERLRQLNLKQELRGKDFEFFRSIRLLNPAAIISRCLDYHIYLTEQRLFRRWLIDLAVFINHEIYGGSKSGFPGIDLEFIVGQTCYLVIIQTRHRQKDHLQIEKAKQDFKTVKKTFSAKVPQNEPVLVLGSPLLSDGNFNEREFLYYSGRSFWELISGDVSLYDRVLEPIIAAALTTDDRYNELFAGKMNLFWLEFYENFCRSDSSIDWEKLVRFNSGKDKVELDS